METQVKFIQNHFKTLGFIMSLMIVSLTFSQAFAQTTSAQHGRTIKGVISNSEGPLESASIVLKGAANIGTSTNSKGEFTFPQPLKTGDVLVITYLGLESQQVTIKDDINFLRLELNEELVEFVGAPNSDKPYKSKRTKD